MASIRKVKGVKTRNGKPIWVDELNYGEEYSEKTESYDYGDGYLVTPTNNPETGDRYDIDMLMDPDSISRTPLAGTPLAWTPSARIPLAGHHQPGHH